MSDPLEETLVQRRIKNEAEQDVGCGEKGFTAVPKAAPAQKIPYMVQEVRQPH